MSDWDDDQQEQLLENVQRASENIFSSYRSAEPKLDWEEIRLEGKSAEECREKFNALISKVRKFRTLTEIISDAKILLKNVVPKKKVHSDFPKRPLSAYILFVRKKAKKLGKKGGGNQISFKDIAKMWQGLSPRKKEVYKKKAARLEEEFKEKLEEFQKNHPEVALQKPQLPIPSKLFVEDRFGKLQAKYPEMSHAEVVKKCMERYDKLSKKKKLKWIKRTLSALSDYEIQCTSYQKMKPKTVLKPAKLVLTKEEKKALAESRGKPKTVPPKNVFMYFCKSRRSQVSTSNIGEQSKALSAEYHNLQQEELDEMSEKLKEEVHTYIDEYTKYYTSLSEEDQRLETDPDAVQSAYQNILNRKVLKNTVRKRDATKKGNNTKNKDIDKENDATKKKDTTKKKEPAEKDSTKKNASKVKDEDEDEFSTPKSNKKSSAKQIISNGPDALVTTTENANHPVLADSGTERKRGKRKHSKAHAMQAESTEKVKSEEKSEVDLKPPKAGLRKSKRQKLNSENRELSNSGAGDASNADDLLSLWSPVKQEL